MFGLAARRGVPGGNIVECDSECDEELQEYRSHHHPRHHPSVSLLNLRIPPLQKGLRSPSRSINR